MTTGAEPPSEPPEDPRERVRALRSRRAEQARVYRRRRLVALAILFVSLLLLARAVADDSNEPPPFIEGAQSGSAAAQSPGATDQGASAESEPVELTVAATGDFLIHEPVFARALENGGGDRYDFRPMFREIRPYVGGADLAICHVETPMTDAAPTGYPVFNTPPALARAIADTGWDMCSTASNHSLDRGLEGIRETNAVLDQAGIAHAGSYGSRREAAQPAIFEVEGVRVALLAYTEMTNGIPLPEPWSVNLAKASRILADAHEARRAGADAVIVNLHAGEEFQSEPSDAQRRLARSLTASDDVTAVIGQHVHIPQPIEQVNGKIVVYGEGNLVSNQTAACCPEASQDGLIAMLDLVVDADGARVERARYVPVWVRHPDYTVLPVGNALREGEAPEAELRASYERTTDVAGRGARVKPVPPRPG